MTGPPEWAEWAAYQWACGRAQWQIAAELNCTGAAVSKAIGRLLCAAYPDRIVYPNSRSEPTPNVWGDDRRALAQAYVQRRPVPATPPPGACNTKLSPALLRARREGPRPLEYITLPTRRHCRGRIFDPDEGQSPRDLWITYTAGSDGLCSWEVER